MTVAKKPEKTVSLTPPPLRIDPTVPLGDHTVATTTPGFICKEQVWNIMLKKSKP